MAGFVDRRSLDGRKPAEPEPPRTPQITKDGRLRRAGGPGSRTFNDYFFAPGHPEKPVKRQELLGLLEMIEWHRRESTWWRRLWRLLHGEPLPSPLPAKLARAFQKYTVDPTIEAVAKALEENAAGAGAP